MVKPVSSIEKPYATASPGKGSSSFDSFLSNVKHDTTYVDHNLIGGKLCKEDGANPVYISSSRKWKFHVRGTYQLAHQGGGRLLLPVGINHTVVPVYDNEPASIISYALASSDYHFLISNEHERSKDLAESFFSFTIVDSGNLLSPPPLDETSSKIARSLRFFHKNDSLTSEPRSSHSQPILYAIALHPRVSFEDDNPPGKVRYTVTCYYATRFDALRRICCLSELDYVRSLSRCEKYDAQGGKNNVFFAKSLDERFIIKQVTKAELESFLKFAPSYVKYLSDSMSDGHPTCLAKILGIYQITSKQLEGGKETKMDVLVMENLLYRRSITRLYDLKGSPSRHNPDSCGSNKVLLDRNLVETTQSSPIFVGNNSKRLLERALWNDTAFLASVDVMDYSLLVGVDEEKHELVVGIISFMRQYTWDKHLENCLKTYCISCLPKIVPPTIIPPKPYKNRLRKAVTSYFPVVPDL